MQTKLAALPFVRVAAQKSRTVTICKRWNDGGMRNVYSVVSAGIRWTGISRVFPEMATSTAKKTTTGEFTLYKVGSFHLGDCVYSNYRLVNTSSVN